MTMQAFPTVAFPEPFFANPGSNLLLDASGEKAALVFQADRSASFDRVCFVTNTVTTGGTVDVRLETVDASMNPSGTLVGTNTNASQIINAADDNVAFEVTLTAAASLTRGTWYALVIHLTTAGNLNIRRSGTPTWGVPYSDHFTGSWSKNSAQTCAAFRTTGGVWWSPHGLWPMTNTVNYTYNSGSTPDEYGNKIVLPTTCRVTGAWVGPASSTGDHEVRLYDSTDTIVASTAFDGDVLTNTGQILYFDDADLDLAAGTYRITKLATSGISANLTAGVTVPAGMETTLPGGGAVSSTKRTDLGAWTDTANEVLRIGLLISGFDDGAGGGGSASPFAYGFAG